jgi:hypothetical protein
VAYQRAITTRRSELDGSREISRRIFLNATAFRAFRRVQVFELQRGAAIWSVFKRDLKLQA